MQSFSGRVTGRARGNAANGGNSMTSEEGSSASLISRTARSPGLKLLVIVALTIAMAVPLFLVQMAVSERQATAAGAATDIAQGYGGPQTVAGPVLLLPYTIQRSET